MNPASSFASTVVFPRRSPNVRANETVSALVMSDGVTSIRSITGGGLKENVPRVLPEGLGVALRRDAWPVPDIFVAIAEAGGVQVDEMWRTFNMGIGMVLIVPAEQAETVTGAAGMPVFHIGTVVEQSGAERVVLH